MPEAKIRDRLVGAVGLPATKPARARHGPGACKPRPAASHLRPVADSARRGASSAGHPAVSEPFARRPSMYGRGSMCRLVQFW